MMIFRKRQLVIGALVAVIGCAVYLNWSISRSDLDAAIDRPAGALTTIAPSPGTTPADAQTGQVLGQAQLVGVTEKEEESALTANPVDRSDYFATARLNRSQARDETLDLLWQMSADQTLPESERKQAATDIAAIAAAVETEADIETLIKGKGFAEALAVLEKNGITVMLQGTLDDKAVAQVTEIILGQTDVPAAGIKLVEVK